MDLEIRTSPTFRLLALPSIWEGIGSVVDLAGCFHRYNDSRTPADADRESLRSDLEAVGRDMEIAVGAVREELQAIE